MSALTSDQVQALAKRLRQRREQLRAELSRALLEMGDSNLQDIAGRVHDAGDESIAEVVAALKVGAAERETAELHQVESALERVRSDRYGACVDCGGDIGFARLQAAPAAARCVQCQGKQEDLRGAHDTTPSL